MVDAYVVWLLWEWKKVPLLDPKFTHFPSLFMESSSWVGVSKGSSPLSCFECFVMLENVLLKLNSVVEHFRLKGMIFVLMKIMSWFKIHNFLQF